MTKWDESAVPDQSGRTVLITGANSGLGLYSARVMASRGARVLLGCRDPERGQRAVEQVGRAAHVPPELVELDLASLDSVREAASRVRERTGDRLEVLMNNAGVMATPPRRTTDGFELQFGTNHLGHAALTWLLMPALRGGEKPRVVTLSSLAHHGNGLDTSDPGFLRRRYSPLRAYAQSKLANLLFSRELDSRIRAAGLDVVSAAAHPGMTETQLAPNSARQRALPSFVGELVSRGNALVTQRVELGALPQLYAATAPGVRGGDYFGPARLAETRGHPKRARRSSAARDDTSASRLWELTAELTGVTPDPA
ncbi:protochlorophyllide oxidoreductase [Actinopolyspora erythraea]|uniref:Protochlorophyllide oxidoreductase n=1 Tax=Actinopolyspora erythraea TaxID=414996 RepID=A0A099D5G1_9ACTN|nr:oxidoreductase [Actinopolyspora erythraea]ASU79586.1 protochlorophyllide oxidoreductase [Actinopolyspora erythraea]KGI81022.1 protochlorophyllide oxidoreductase [Actinopolyspora erythraea]